jgi:hypothetical protein
MDPHILFSLSTYVESQSEFIDLIIPEFKQPSDEPTNLNNLTQFDLLLTHLETTFRSNIESSKANSASPYANFKIPSEQTLRVIITIASRSPETNWTNTNPNIEGLTTTNNYVKKLNEDYYNSLSKSPLRDRSIWLLQQYLSIIRIHSDDPLIQILYKRFVSLFKDFIVQNYVRKKTRSTGPLIKPRSSLTLSPVKHQTTILNFFQKKTASHLSSPIGSDDTIADEVVSDSEDVMTILDSTTKMEEELKKFHGVPNQLSSNLFTSVTNSISGLNNSAALFSNISSERDSSPRPTSPRPKKKSKPNRSATPISYPALNWKNLKVFDEDILSIKLNPKLNHRFNIWLLINWTFYCADKSTNLSRLLANCSFTAFHSVYITHHELLSFIFDFLSFDLINGIKNDPDIQELLVKSHDPIRSFFKSKNSSRSVILGHLENSKFLILNLMTQLGSLQIDWYDRIVEYVFNGLGVKSNEIPQSCYEREKFLIKLDSSVKEQFLDIESNVEHTDNINSMKLRFKIILLVYYRALYFSGGSIVGANKKSDIHLSPTILIIELCHRFMAIDWIYMREFYSLPSYSENIISLKYQISLLTELAETLLLDITKIAEVEKFTIQRLIDDSGKPMKSKKHKSPSTKVDHQISLRQNPVPSTRPSNLREQLEELEDYIENDTHWQLTNITQILSTINDRDIYLQVIEDETFKSSSEFEQAWQKLNFLFEWMLNLALNDLEAMDQQGDLSIMRNSCRDADILRASLLSGRVREVFPSETFEFATTYLDIFSEHFWHNEDLF